jgi:hypothetical protein
MRPTTNGQIMTTLKPIFSTQSAHCVNSTFSLRALAARKLRLVHNTLGCQAAEKPDVRARSQESQNAVTN